jgi:hypothetical protein
VRRWDRHRVDAVGQRRTSSHAFTCCRSSRVELEALDEAAHERALLGAHLEVGPRERAHELDQLQSLAGVEIFEHPDILIPIRAWMQAGGQRGWRVQRVFVREDPRDVGGDRRVLVIIVPVRVAVEPLVLDDVPRAVIGEVDDLAPCAVLLLGSEVEHPLPDRVPRLGRQRLLHESARQMLLGARAHRGSWCSSSHASS